MTRRCSACGANGHNARTCPTSGSLRKVSSMPVFGNAGGSDDEDDEGFDRVLEGDEAEAGPPHRPHGLAGDAHHNARDDGARVERKKGVAWSEEEHRLFLTGLTKLGKGDWRGISRHFVLSRTPTQVASHAQKYFIRQSNLNKRKRRSSLFDMSPEFVPSGLAGGPGGEFAGGMKVGAQDSSAALSLLAQQGAYSLAQSQASALAALAARLAAGTSSAPCGLETIAESRRGDATASVSAGAHPFFGDLLGVGGANVQGVHVSGQQQRGAVGILRNGNSDAFAGLLAAAASAQRTGREPERLPVFWPSLAGMAPPVPTTTAPAPSAPAAAPPGASTAVTDTGLLRGHLGQLSPPFARAAHLASSLGADPKLFRPTPARATSATWSMVRSASLPNLEDIVHSEEDEISEEGRRQQLIMKLEEAAAGQAATAAAAPAGAAPGTAAASAPAVPAVLSVSDLAMSAELARALQSAAMEQQQQHVASDAPLQALAGAAATAVKGAGGAPMPTAFPAMPFGLLPGGYLAAATPQPGMSDMTRPPHGAATAS